MKKIISICGINCSECKAYIATQNDDDAARIEVAETWSKMYDTDIDPQDIVCDGCTTEGGRHFNYCNICEIRACGIERGLANCAACEDYICDRLEGFFKMAPEAKVNLEAVRGNQ